mgnify:CR=1 FL=1
MVTSLVGVVFIQKTARQFLEDKLSFLVSFSAGVFLVVAGALGLEVFHVVESVWTGVALIVAGYLLAWGMHALLPETHHHHDEDCKRSHGGVKKLIIGDAIHNVADGIIIVVAFATSPELGLAVTMSVVIHEALQEVSEFFVLRQAGYSVKKALTINFAVSSTILLGVLLGQFALASSTMEVTLLAISAGFFLHVVAHDLLPKRAHHETSSAFGRHLMLVVAGAIIMAGLNALVGDSHEHGHGEEVNKETSEHELRGFFDRLFHHDHD